jgi:hypothetical protein
MKFEEEVVTLALNLANRDLHENATVSKRLSLWISNRMIGTRLGDRRTEARKLWQVRRTGLSPASFSGQGRKLRSWLEELTKGRRSIKPLYREGYLRRAHLGRTLRRLVAFPTTDQNFHVTYETITPSVEDFIAFSYAIMADPSRGWRSRIRLCKGCKRTFFLSNERGRRRERCTPCAKVQTEKLAAKYHSEWRKRRANARGK